MSTRRARIKAVASLPVRRKNLESQIKEEKPIRSPKTPRAPHEVHAKSPLVKTASPVRSPQEAKTVHTPKAIDLLSPQNVPVTVNTPKHNEKVPVITPVSRAPVSNTFASPLQWSSPARRALPSPKAPSITEAFVEKLQSPNRCKSMPDGVQKPKAEVSGVYEIRTVEQRVEKPEDYNPPSVPESITDETAMDGIIPLHPNRNIPKPIDFLKSEIISENAPVLFDPIVPLPSPSKARPKLRPAPRLAPHRRNSIQGSASESEDDSRRSLLGGAAAPAPARQRHDSQTSHSTMHSLLNREVTRIRNDSVCSGVSQVAAAVPASPLKERHLTKWRRQDISRRLAAVRRQRIPSKRDALTMYDLIYYNPTTNPIVPDQDELKAKEATLKDEEERKKAAAEETEETEDADDPPEAAPVPQIKLGPNGEIMLDEQSLVIKRTDSRRRLATVREGAWGGGAGRYSRAPRTPDWRAAETVRFYRALAAVGTDFTLMAPLFPDRTRRDLKLKFKKEERLNGAQVDKALRSQTTWDALALQDEFAAEREAAERRARAEREQLAAARTAQRARASAAAHARLRQSRGAKALETETDPETVQPAAREPVTADDFILQALKAKPRRKRRPHAPKPHPPPNGQNPPAPNPQPPNDEYATLTLIKNPTPARQLPLINVNPNKSETNIPQVPPNIEAGSLVVLTVNDPKSPTKKMLQTYISRGAGQLSPVALPPTLLNSVMGYMKKGTPKSNVSNSSSPLMSPSSVASVESRTSVASASPSVIQLNPSPNKRQRHSSYSITQL